MTARVRRGPFVQENRTVGVARPRSDPPRPGLLGTLLGLLSRRERYQACGLMALMGVNAIVETGGVASIMPLLAVLDDPLTSLRRPELEWLGRYTSGLSPERLPIVLGGVTLVIMVSSALVRLTTEYAVGRFVELRRHSLSSRLLERYLRQPYSYFLERNPAELSQTMLSEVDTVVQLVLFPALRIPVYGLAAAGLVTLLVVVDPVGAGMAGVVVTLTYLGLYGVVRRTLLRRGEWRVDANRERFATTAEVFGGIKAVKHLGREAAYLNAFRSSSHVYAHQIAVSRVVSATPRYVVEVVAIGGLLLLTLSRTAAGGELSTMLPLLGLYAFAGYRILPAVQHVYASATALRFGLPAARPILRDLHAPLPPLPADRSGLPAMRLRESISLRDVGFTYPKASRPALEGVSVEIAAGEFVAVVGETGAGKSTMVDLILGLLSPTRGEIRIDGHALHGEFLASWQQAVGYVPQRVFLADDTILANIAFGVPSGARDRDAAARAASQAGLADVLRDRPLGLDTPVGGNGVHLSGGERQRLGIARALYTQPSVLLLDEATSNLDRRTARDVMDRLVAMVPAVTIIVIAHDRSHIEGVGRRLVLERGRLASRDQAETETAR